MRRDVAQAVLLCGVIFWYATILRGWQTMSLPDWVRSQDRTWSAIQELQHIRPEIRNKAKILFLNDPFEDWDMVFVGQIVLREKQSHITLQRKHDHILSTEEIEL